MSTSDVTGYRLIDDLEEADFEKKEINYQVMIEILLREGFTSFRFLTEDDVPYIGTNIIENRINFHIDDFGVIYGVEEN